MPRKQQVPSYRLHKARNCAVVTIAGHNHYLGPYGSPESHAQYAALIAEWQRLGAQQPQMLADGPSFTIGQLALADRKHAAAYYKKNDRVTSQFHTEAAVAAGIEMSTRVAPASHAFATNSAKATSGRWAVAPRVRVRKSSSNCDSARHFCFDIVGPAFQGLQSKAFARAMHDRAKTPQQRASN